MRDRSRTLSARHPSRLSGEALPSRSRRLQLVAAAALVSFALGVFVGARAVGTILAVPAGPPPRDAAASRAEPEGSAAPDLGSLLDEVNPPEGYQLPISYGDLGPRLIKSGAIDYDRFVALYQVGGAPLSDEQKTILMKGSNEPIVLTRENAHFLLNLLWGAGLANENPILTNGLIMQQADGEIERFASTGGWTLGSEPVGELYASAHLVTLTAEQQARVEQAAATIYRPCCDNPTSFPDCNHGMAMLGLLELMAAEDASLQEMLVAAKYVNAFWFPQQALETAIYLRSTQGVSFADAAPALVTGRAFSSGSGASQIHQQLESAGLLPRAPDGSGSCAA